MRHRRKGRVLGRKPNHQRALLRNLASALFLTERDAEYRRADHILETTGRTVEECLQELASLSRSVVVPHVTVTPKASG